MIARTWRGATGADDADRYLQYLHQTGLTAFRDTPGNRGAAVLRRVVDGRAEFVVLSLWDSVEAVRAFAGADPGRAVFFPDDARYLVDRDLHVDHFDLVYAAGALAGSAAA
jgi:heme-degrading monooxygenase HmoA